MIDFQNPYYLVLKAFTNLYGENHNLKIRFCARTRKILFFGCWGYFNPDENEIVISAWLPVYHSTEILAHELAHYIAGIEASHGSKWKKIFTDIHIEWKKVTEIHQKNKIS